MALSADQKLNATVGGAWIAILAALALWASQLAGTPPAPPPVTMVPTTSTTTSTSPTTTAVASPLSQKAKPFFGPAATWNQPVSNYGFSTKYAGYADRLWTDGGQPAPAGTVNVAFGDYSVPFYDSAEATTVARFYQNQASSLMYGPSNTGLKAGVALPWNPNWRPGPGNDNLMIIVDYKTGTWWELGGIGQLPINCFVNFANLGAGFEINNPLHLCGYGINRSTGLYTMVDGQTFVGRGMGIPKAALITRVHEVQSGKIAHALEMTIPSTMWGEPPCLEGSPGAGSLCGFYVKPATRVEWTVNSAKRCAPNPTLPINRTVPEGMRFALTVTDVEIEKWLDTRKYTGALRNTARIFAVALRDYGWIIAETGCYGSSIEVEGLVDPAAAKIWATLGVPNKETGSALLQGLITKSNFKVVEPPA